MGSVTLMTPFCAVQEVLGVTSATGSAGVGFMVTFTVSYALHPLASVATRVTVPPSLTSRVCPPSTPFQA